VSIRTTKQALDEHTVLRDRVEHFLVDAHAMPGLDLGARIDSIERTTTFLVEVLLPHAAVEERVLYPGAARLAGGPDESDTIKADRRAVRDLLAQLALVDPGDAGAIQEVLYALYAMLSAHFWREEEVFVRLASVRDEKRVRAVIERMTAMRTRRRRFQSRARAAPASR
jgi:hemerythrin superfamily protein